MKYDYLLIGAGLFNAIFANEAKKSKKKCLVIEKRDHIGGNVYCETIDGIVIHKYGPHIFHTDNTLIWEYVNNLGAFNHFINSPIAIFDNKVYNLPFNMNTFYQLWGTITPEKAKEIIDRQRLPIENPQNLEEMALSLVGHDVYCKLIKGYTEKQWGKNAKDLPAFIIKRLPVRFNYNNNYFNCKYQGVPLGGYNSIIEKCLEDCDIMLNMDFFDDRLIVKKARNVIFTGMIDQYYDYCFGKLEYRSLRFENFSLRTDNYQGNAIVNFTDKEVPYTRIIEHKHFEFGQQDNTVITKEYPMDWNLELEPFYPVNSIDNEIKYEKYKTLSLKEDKIHFSGRLGMYKYMDMDKIVESALKLCKDLN